jgi:hypothetical protein
MFDVHVLLSYLLGILFGTENLTLKMEAVYSSETLVTTCKIATRRYYPDDHSLNPKSAFVP